MLKPGFIDLSHHNTVPESFADTINAGIIGVIHKMTESSSYVDDKADNRRYMAQEAGMMWGLYHFVRPGSMEQQVDFFLEKARPYADDDTLFALDWEDTGVSLDDAVEFMEMLETATGRSPVMYSGHVLKEALAGKADSRLSRWRLWLAQYSSTPELPPGYDTYWGWQYTDQGSCAGVNSPVDLNAYLGTSEQLIASWSGAEDVPEPEPAPPPSEVSITMIVPAGVSVRVLHEQELFQKWAAHAKRSR